MKRLVLFVAALFVAVSATASADRDDAARVALDFYRAYAGSDLDGALALWSPHSPSLDRMRRKARLLRTHCFELGTIDTTVTAIDERSATVDVRAEWLDTTQMPGALPIVDFADGTIVLRRDATRWRIVDWRPSAVDFAEALIKADAAERARILTNPRVRCRTAVREIARRAVTLVNQGDYDRSDALDAAATEIADAIDDDASRALAAAASSITERHRTHLDHAHALADRAVRLAEHGGDADALVRALLASEAWDTTTVARALTLRDVTSDPALIALAATRTAAVIEESGDHWSALQYVKISERYADESGDPAAMINAELNLAGTYGLYGDLELAVQHLRDSIVLSKRANFAPITADNLLTEADLEDQMGHAARAARLTEEASRIPINDGLVMLHLEMRRFYANRDAADADRRIAAVLRTAERRGDESQACEVIRLMIQREFERGHRKAALRLLKELHAPRRVPTNVQYANALITAWVERQIGRTDEALQAVRNAIAISEQERTRILGNDRQPQLFFRRRLQAYQELAAILATTGRALDALAASDEAKGRTLLDILRNNHLSVESAMDADERSREQQLRERAAALRREGADAATLAQSRTDIDNFENAMTVKYPGAAPTWSAPAMLTESTLRQVLTEPDFAVVEYMITSDRLYVFVGTRGADGNPRVRVRSTAIRDTTLHRKIARFAGSVALADDEFASQARRLYDLLLSPIAPELAHARVVCIIPDGRLRQLPFESLIAPDGKLFVEHAAAFYAPSIAVYAQMGSATAQPREHTEGTLFALADPAVGVTRDGVISRLRAGEATPLPDAAREVETVARILGGKSAVYIGASASRERFETEAPAYRIVHFATHGVLDDTDPMYSHLVLAPSGRGDDGVLEAWQMMRTKLHAELAVLSACNTARGGVREGEGVVGMSWALFVAGCPSTIAAQWRIASAPTADLMIAFYRHWNALGDEPFAKTKALAAAQREMLHRRGKRHPFFWAAFILVGVG